MTKPTGRKRTGRPPLPVPRDKADAVLAWLHAGRSLLSFCAQEGMPHRQTITENWCAKDPIFAEQFARARIASADVLVEQAQEVADSSTPENVQCAKLRADVLLRRAACYDPRRYGQNQRVEHDHSVAITLATGIPGQLPAPAAQRITLEPPGGEPPGA